MSERTLLPMFNWQAFFYDRIPLEKQTEANKLLKHIKEYHSGEKNWQDRIKKRGNAFFLIAGAWI